MLTQRYRTVLLSAVLLCASQAGAQSDPGREEWVQLFNGKDLSGWTVKINGYDLGDNFGNTFRVEDGMLKVSYDQYTDFGERFGHIFHQQKFSHYASLSSTASPAIRRPEAPPGCAGTAASWSIHKRPKRWA